MQVTLKGELYNIYTDTQGEQQTRLLGNVSDLRRVKVKEIGGIPIEKLQAHYEIQRNRAGKKDPGMPDTIIGFPDQTRVPLPPDTVRVYKVSDLSLSDRWRLCMPINTVLADVHSSPTKGCSNGPGQFHELPSICQDDFLSIQLFVCAEDWSLNA